MTDRTLHLAAGGLADEAEEGELIEVRTPQHHGVAAGEVCSFGVDGDMPGDQGEEPGGTDLALGPLEEPMEILGQAVLDLAVVPRAPTGQIHAVLIDAWPDGARTQIARGTRNLNDAAGRCAPTPGEEVAATVTLHGTACRLEPGHRLVLRLSTGSWPLLWLRPDAAGVDVLPGRSTLRLPLRAPREDAPRALPEPPEAGPEPVSTVREGAQEVARSTDPETGVVTFRTRVLGGVFGPIGVIRLDNIGTEIGVDMTVEHAIHPDDPLSARTTVDQSFEIGREGWRVVTEARAEMRCDAERFLLHATLAAHEDGAVVAEREWREAIPRRRL